MRVEYCTGTFKTNKHKATDIPHYTCAKAMVQKHPNVKSCSVPHMRGGH